MNIHKNAALTPRGRGRLLNRIEAGESGAAAAAAVGVSERTVWKWVGRVSHGGGQEALGDRSSRPHHSPNRVRRTRERQVVRLRQKRWTQAAIARLVADADVDGGAVCRRTRRGPAT